MSDKLDIFSCDKCSHISHGWVSKCPECGCNQINPLFDHKLIDNNVGYAGMVSQDICRLNDIKVDVQKRYKTGFSNMDFVLGGGLSPGSVVLLSGDEGVGKSTAILQIANQLGCDLPILYVTGEESLEQISLRAKRLDLDLTELELLGQTQVEIIIKLTNQRKKKLLIVDSVQTLWVEACKSSIGNRTQVIESVKKLIRYAKSRSITVILIGQVSKDGKIAGPKTLEHMVDTTLLMRNVSGSTSLVSIRTLKNRFGPAQIMGFLDMKPEGLVDVENYASLFLDRASTKSLSGCVSTVAVVGGRPLFFDVEVLVEKSEKSRARRTAIGLDPKVLDVVLLLLKKYTDLSADGYDVIVKVPEEVSIHKKEIELAVILAVYSAIDDLPVPRNWLVLGEVRLSGALCIESTLGAVLSEAVQHDFEHVLLPKVDAYEKNEVHEIQLHYGSDVQEAVNLFIDKIIDTV